MDFPVYPVVSLIMGLVFVANPNILRIGIWKETSILQRMLTPKQYNIYMRTLGVIMIVIGVFLIFKNAKAV